MSDILTQLQESMDLVHPPLHALNHYPPANPVHRTQLCTMFIAGLYYVERHHDLEQFNPNDKIPDLKADQPKEGAHAHHPLTYTTTSTGLTNLPLFTYTVETLDPQTFRDGQAEVARDMIVQAQRIEYLVSELPGLQNSERDQLRIISGLEEEIAGLEAQRLEAVRERDEVFGQLDALVRSLQRP
jgi:mediator of RNA polymerase II transcription subunit 21